MKDLTEDEKDALALLTDLVSLVAQRFGAAHEDASVSAVLVIAGRMAEHTIRSTPVDFDITEFFAAADRVVRDGCNGIDKVAGAVMN